jgi:hypothetical protein
MACQPLRVFGGPLRPLFFPALGMAIDLYACSRTSVIFAQTRRAYTVSDMVFPSAKNRRRSHRQWVSVPVLIRHRGSRIDGHCINISEGGMYLFAAAQLLPGTQIEIEFRPPHVKEVVRAIGAVRRRALYLYGIEFLSDDAVTGDRTNVQTENPTPATSANL